MMTVHMGRECVQAVAATPAYLNISSLLRSASISHTYASQKGIAVAKENQTRPDPKSNQIIPGQQAKRRAAAPAVLARQVKVMTQTCYADVNRFCDN